MEMIGEIVGERYHILETIGAGAMATVYKAEDTEARGMVAVKMMHPDLIPGKEGVSRFHRERDILNHLNHPNIVAFIDSFKEEGNYFIVMEYVDGGSLADLLKDGSLPIKRAKEIAIQVCDALTEAHRREVIHRDIKPSNILLTQECEVKVADFGIARLVGKTILTRTGTQFGSAPYMSPEAWRGEKLNAQADIYSLGIMLYAMLAGELPFKGSTLESLYHQHLYEQPKSLRPLYRNIP